MSKIVVRAWNVNSTFVNPGMRSKDIHLLMEKNLNLKEEHLMHSPVDAKLEPYLVLVIEGNGPAVGESVS